MHKIYCTAATLTDTTATPFELRPVSGLNGLHQNFNGPELGHLHLVPRQMLSTANEKIIRYWASNALPLISVIDTHDII